MKFKTTLILLAVAGALFCYIRFYESKQDTTPVAKLRGEHLVLFDPEAVDGMTITNNGEKIELRKQDNAWWVVSPVKDLANLTLVHDNILVALHDLQVIDSFQAGGKNPTLKEMGLETPVARVKFSGSDAPAEYQIGNDTAVQGEMYMRMADSNLVCVVDNKLRSDVQKKLDDFRDRRLIEVAPQFVARLDIRSPAGEIEALQERNVWALSKPLQARADSLKIGQLVSQTLSAHIEGFLPDDGANLASYGLAEPRGTITLNIAGSNTPAVLQIGQPVENDRKKVYAKLSTRESVLVLPESINDVLFMKPNDVRDRRLMELNVDMVDRIHIDYTGKPRLTIGRKGEDWILKTYSDLPANTNQVRGFIAYLGAPILTGFVSDVASDLPKYGLDKPLLRVTFSSYASQTTAETSPGEDTILSVSFGKSDDNTVYARLDSEPYVVAFPKMLPDGHTIFDAISPDPVYWEDLSIFKYKPEEIVSLEIMRGSQTTSLERAAGSTQWTLKEGLGTLDQTTVQSLVNTLSSLHGAFSLGSATAGLGFDRPELVVTFTTAAKQVRKLTLGSKTDDNMWNAEAEGRAGAFLVSQPDFDALSADVTGKASDGGK